jgi:hypothetical protein
MFDLIVYLLPLALAGTLTAPSPRTYEVGIATFATAEECQQARRGLVLSLPQWAVGYPVCEDRTSTARASADRSLVKFHHRAPGWYRKGDEWTPDFGHTWEVSVPGCESPTLLTRESAVQCLCIKETS